MPRLCLLGSELEMLGPLERQLLLRLTFLALQPQNDFTCGLGLLVEHWLGLPSKSHLLGVVSALALSKVRCFTRLVLSDLMHLVLAALFACTECLALLRDIHHFNSALSGMKGEKRKHEHMTILSIEEKGKCLVPDLFTAKNGKEDAKKDK